MNLLAVFFVAGLITILFMENSRLSSRIKDMDWYYTQDREKRLRMETRLEKRISELDSRLRQRIHSEVRKAKKADDQLSCRLFRLEYPLSQNQFKESSFPGFLVLPDVLELQSQIKSQNDGLS